MVASLASFRSFALLALALPFSAIAVGCAAGDVEEPAQSQDALLGAEISIAPFTAAGLTIDAGNYAATDPAPAASLHLHCAEASFGGQGLDPVDQTSALSLTRAADGSYTLQNVATVKVRATNAFRFGSYCKAEVVIAFAAGRAPSGAEVGAFNVYFLNAGFDRIINFTTPTTQVRQLFTNAKLTIAARKKPVDDGTCIRGATMIKADGTGLGSLDLSSTFDTAPTPCP